MSAHSVPVFCREEIERALESLLPSEEEPKILHAAMRYSVLSPGKRVRPSLVLASCRAVGGAMDEALDAAAAVEMVHVFSLIHDDLPAIDDDDLRRGQPTCHRVYGEAIAILAGDALFSLAFKVLASMKCTAEQRTRCVEELATQTGSEGVVGGEVMDILAEGKTPSLLTSTEIHRRKTGALMAGSCAIGGIIGGGTEQEIGALRSFGSRLGIAFQIIDDILNETATAEALGKSVGSDRARGKMTYPALMGVPEARKAAERLISEAESNLATLPGDTSWMRQFAEFAIERDR